MLCALCAFCSRRTKCGKVSSMAEEVIPVPEELQSILAEVVDRIVQIADPQAIVLFGSHAECGNDA